MLGGDWGIAEVEGCHSKRLFLVSPKGRSYDVIRSCGSWSCPDCGPSRRRRIARWAKQGFSCGVFYVCVPWEKGLRNRMGQRGGRAGGVDALVFAELADRRVKGMPAPATLNVHFFMSRPLAGDSAPVSSDWVWLDKAAALETLEKVLVLPYLGLTSWGGWRCDDTMTPRPEKSKTGSRKIGYGHEDQRKTFDVAADSAEEIYGVRPEYEEDLPEQIPVEEWTTLWQAAWESDEALEDVTLSLVMKCSLREIVTRHETAHEPAHRENVTGHLRSIPSPTSGNDSRAYRENVTQKPQRPRLAPAQASALRMLAVDIERAAYRRGWPLKEIQPGIAIAGRDGWLEAVRTAVGDLDADALKRLAEVAGVLRQVDGLKEGDAG